MRRSLNAAATIAALLLVVIASILGWFTPVDRLLRDVRAGLHERAPTGSVIFVDIDSRAIDTVGVWPWPRSVHAEIIARLMELGAAEIAFDVDFSSPSDPDEDQRLAAELEAAGGYVLLAAFRQYMDGSGPSAYNMPIPRFSQFADPVAVNIPVEDNGVVRRYPYAVMLGDDNVPSMAATLSGVSGPADTFFEIDYSIDPGRIARISVADLLQGRVEPAQVRDRQVVVGASALELGDNFVVPRHGVLPGGVVQIVAAETLLQGRALQPVGSMPVLAAMLILGALYASLIGRLQLLHVIVAATLLAACFEMAALRLHIGDGLLLDTGALHAFLMLLLVDAARRDIRRNRLLQERAAEDRDAMRIILDRVIADNFDGVVVVDETGVIVAASRLAEDLLGAGLRERRSDESLPSDLSAAVATAVSSPIGSVAPRVAEARLNGADGTERIIEYAVTLSQVTASTPGAAGRRVACLTFRDITERRRDEERLQFLAAHDPLTGAYSRLRLVEMMNDMLAKDVSRGAGIVVIVLDLRRFKTVNDTLGHIFGDSVLKQVVSRIRSCSVDAVARMGGDSFALVLAGERAREDMASFCARLLERLTLPYHLAGGHQAIIAASAGVTSSALSGYDPEVLLSHADMALASAKAMSSSHFVVFRQEMEDQLLSKREMELALGEAIEKQQLSLAYQPQVCLDSGVTVGVEALLRWTHPRLGVVSPAQFIPAAEETGQIIQLGRWALRTACAEVARWPTAIRLAVNVSPVQFALVDVASEVEFALRDSGLAPSRLDIEITEGLFLANSATVTQVLQRLRDAGVGVAIDDFGTGYSSLSYLGRLPVDKIKIDQSFVRRLPGDAESEAILTTVMALSQTLDKTVVAEGVETADQAWMLRIMGCAIGQGYHFSRPLTAAQMQEWLSRGDDADRQALAG